MRGASLWAATLALAATAVVCVNGLAGCAQADSVVLVTVSGDPAVTGVVQLRATLSNQSMWATNLFPQHVAAGAPVLTFPTMFTLTVPRARSGTLDVALDGLDASGIAIANGTASVTLLPGGTTDLAISLRAGASLCGNGRVDPGEQCDDGNRVSEGVCDFTCQRAGGSGAGGATGTGGASGAGGGTGMDGGKEAGGVAGNDGGRIDGGPDAADSGPAPCTQELLQNGNFDRGDEGWTETTSGRLLIYNYNNAVDHSIVPEPRSLPDLAWMGYDAVSETALLQQSFNVPLNALSLTVSGYYIINTMESGCDCDVASIDLMSPVYTHNVHSWSNKDANTDWTAFTTTLDITPAAGDTLAFQVSATMDDGVITSFFFDDLSVTANFCP